MKKWETPFTFPSGLIIKNRLVFAPISTMSSNAIGQLSVKEIIFYQKRSQQAGLIILGSANISTKGKAYQNNVSIAHDAVIPNLKKYNESIKESGAKSIIQLYHGGRAIGFLPSQKKLAVVSKLADDRENKYELSEREILSIIEDFGKAIKRAIRAGFDGIEIHAGNPFLIQEFLSPRLNVRQDGWGGNEEKRFRFLEIVLKLAKQLKEEADVPFAIGIRLAIEEKEIGGISFEESCRITKKISKLGVDYIHFNQDSIFEKIDGKYKLQMIDDSIPIIGNGSISNEDKIEEALKITPIVSVARPLILNPEFPYNVENFQSVGDMAQEELFVPKGLLRSIIDSPDWYLNRSIGK